MAFIYKITNLINGKIYVGKTSNTIEERWKQHINDSIKERCEKRPIYDAMNKYGIENFQIEQIEEVENDEIACQREIYWIDKLRTYVGFEDCNGYNATLGGDSKKYYNYKELADAYLELKTVKAVTKKFNCDDHTVRKACEENKVKINSSPRRRQIIGITPNNEILEFDSLTEANLFMGKNYKNGTIYDACHARRGHHKAYGYQWYYKEDWEELQS